MPGQHHCATDHHAPVHSEVQSVGMHHGACEQADHLALALKPWPQIGIEEVLGPKQVRMGEGASFRNAGGAAGVDDNRYIVGSHVCVGLIGRSLL